VSTQSSSCRHVPRPGISSLTGLALEAAGAAVSCGSGEAATLDAAGATVEVGAATSPRACSLGRGGGTASSLRSVDATRPVHAAKHNPNTASCRLEVIAWIVSKGRCGKPTFAPQRPHVGRIASRRPRRTATYRRGFTSSGFDSSVRPPPECHPSRVECCVCFPRRQRSTMRNDFCIGLISES